MVHRTKLTIAYLGGGFSGWQRQARARTVQGELEDALARLTRGRRVPIIGAGRTDAGVHASAQVAHADLTAAIPVEQLPAIINARLAPDVRVRSAVSVSSGFHARKSAHGKRYTYRVRSREPELPWLGLRSAVIPDVIQRHALAEACRLLPGRRSWASFTVPEAARRGAVRTVFVAEIGWRQWGFEVHVIGDGFLRYQVRRMVGALLEVGRGRMTLDELRDLLESPAFGAPLPTAPARGLTLEKVYYRRTPQLRPPASESPDGSG